jgi:hypothetical protein
MSLEIMLGYKNKRDKVTGMVMGVDNVITHCKGLEIGILALPDNNDTEPNLAGIGINVLAGYNSLNGIAASLATGVVGEGGRGVLVSGLNVVSENFKGLNIGVVNLSHGKFYGVQAGLICYATEGNYLQIGLLNFRKDGDKSDFSPGIGYHHSPSSKD